MKQLIIDIGNTRIKTALFEVENIISEKAFIHLEEMIVYVKCLDFDYCLISSVKYTEEELAAALDFKFVFLTVHTAVPISNKYGSPDTLGVDRKAAVIGARALFSSGTLLSIDLGSCITYDFLTSNDEYLGGSISPGMNMRFKAMHQQTARLPLAAIEENEKINLIGDNTISGLQSGVYHGIRLEIEGFITAYQQQHQDLKVIICGGDSKFFETLTKDHIFVIPNLVLYGLNRILTYNVNKK
ncbi:type III pantothenate kinase [Belliella sp. R4-6]|uniref:Type III pantothenate kinase n=1 Tax=Belliella alkalica TaxID=1730871 RepID=A0ABS9VC89_9BACT|nr:type III pantothenate kinase [Belliella alkalica]MCH7414041.1 type III pantothenate kinase [Belliella alkalica]